MLLMNGNRPVLQYQIDDLFIKVIDNDYLPYALKDYVKNCDFTSKSTIRDTVNYINVLKDFLCSRILSMSRENVKSILHSLTIPQRLDTDSALKIVEICNGLSILDNFWIKEEDSELTWEMVNLRKKHLKDAAYQISILGLDMSISKEIMQPDIATNGMFAKTWVRNKDSIELWKTDLTSDCINTKAEKQVSDILDHSNVKHVQYSMFEKDKKKIVTCKCLANDDYSLVNAYDLRDWCMHTEQDFVTFIEEHFLEDFAKMCVIDFIIGNTDRHLGNVNFIVDNSNNKIVEMSPLFDHNQALICDYFNGLDYNLVYEATGLSMIDTAMKYWEASNLELDFTVLPEGCLKRFEDLNTKSFSRRLESF